MKEIDSFPQFVKELPELDLPIAGAKGWLLQGGTQQAVFVEFGETVDVPEHSHQEQWELPVAGKVELRMQGTRTVYRPGESFCIPAGVPHAATVHAGYKAIIFFNERDRYKAKG